MSWGVEGRREVVDIRALKSQGFGGSTFRGLSG